MTDQKEGVDKAAKRLVDMTANNPPGLRFTYEQAQRRAAQAVDRSEQQQRNNNR